MPFFANTTPENVRLWCQHHDLKTLTDLKSRIFNFIKGLILKKDKVKKELPLITEEIIIIEAQLLEHRLMVDAALKARESAIGSLTGNGAERHLMLNSLPLIPEPLSQLEKKIIDLRSLKRDQTSYLARVLLEINACVNELKIVDIAIDEKKVQPAPQVLNPH